MAILSNPAAASHAGSVPVSPPAPSDILNWVQQSMQEMHLNHADATRGTSESLAIDLDEDERQKRKVEIQDARSEYRPRREPLRRDSLKRREALLKGKEGSRRRRQWENGSYPHLMALMTGSSID